MPAVWMLWNSELETELNANRVFIPHSSPILNPELDPSVFAGILFSPSSLLSHPRLLHRRAGEPRRPPHPVTGGPCRPPLPQPAGWRAVPSSPLSPVGRQTAPLSPSRHRRAAPPSPPLAGGPANRAALPSICRRAAQGSPTSPCWQAAPLYPHSAGGPRCDVLVLLGRRIWMTPRRGSPSPPSWGPPLYPWVQEELRL